MFGRKGNKYHYTYECPNTCNSNKCICRRYQVIKCENCEEDAYKLILTDNDVYDEINK